MPTIGSQISVGIVVPDDYNAHFIPEDQFGDGVWEDYYITSIYEGDGHKYMLGVTSPNGFINENGQVATVAFVQLASKTLIWILDWTAARWGSKPRIPDPRPRDGNWVLLDDWAEPEYTIVATDGTTPLWRISGTYIYGHINPSELTVNNIKYPRPPWLDDFLDRTMSPATLDNTLI